MNQIHKNNAMLDLMLRPAFSVEKGVIQYANQAAETYLLAPDMPIAECIGSGLEEYSNFAGGCLYLTLQLGSESLGASVVQMDGQDIFLIEQQETLAELRSLALAAKELREPLAGILAVTDRLFPSLPEKEQTAQINRRLFQMLRTVTNMSDAYRYADSTHNHMECLEIGSFFDEVFEKAAQLLSHGGFQLQYTGLKENVYTLADSERLERSAYNLLSNAAKFSSREGIIQVKLSRRGNRLVLSVSNQGNGLDSNNNIFSRFRREPALEDSRYGLGLGLVLVRATAAAHGGAVLVDQPEHTACRTTMTLAITQAKNAQLRSPAFRFDYAGEWDHALLELADCLPAELYSEI